MELRDEPEVFLSYARRDGRPLVTWLRRRLELEHPDIRLWQDLTDMEGGHSWWAQITEALDAVEIMVLVLTPGAVASPIVRQEWQYARQRGVRIYPVTGTHGPRPDFQAMPRWMSKVHCNDLDTEWDKFINHLKSPGRATRVPFMAPALPRGFVQRPREFDELRTLLLDAEHKDPIAIATSLIGAGGFGKTTLAAALCHDDDVITAFDDGILWVTLGETPDVLGGLTNLYSALAGEDPGFRTVEQAAQRLADRLKDKDVLLVIDDVWKTEHVKPFLAGGDGCARLITTRQLAIADAADCTCIRVDEMTIPEAVQMLTAKLGTIPADLEPFRVLAQTLGEWPLLLDLVGAALRLRLRRGDTLTGALAYVRRGLDQKGVAAFRRDDTTQRDQSIARTMQVSLDPLEPEESLRYFELAIFAEDVAISLEALRALWQLDEYDAERQAERLSDLSLLKYDVQARTIRLHDVVRKYLFEQLADASAVHARLVDAWGDPNHLPDVFAWRWYAYHLVGAKRPDRLRSLLLDFTWLRAKLDATDVTALLADYEHLREDNDLRLVQGAIRLSAHILAREKDQLPGQLLGRLLAMESPAIRGLVEQTGVTTTGPWLRPLAASLTHPGGALLRTLELHTRWINAVAVLPDGRHAIGASYDNTLRLWELDTGRTLRILEGHGFWVTTVVAVLPDGRHALSASYNEPLRLWDLDTGLALRSLMVYSDWVRTVAVLPDGRHALSALGDGTLRLWELDTGRALRTLEGHARGVRAMAVTPDGRHALIALDDETLRLWDLDTGQALRSLEGHSGRVNAVAVLPDGRHAVSASDDYTLQLWDLDSGRVIASFIGDAAFDVCAVGPDGHAIVASDAFGRVHFLRLEGV
jgi:hypothetical protein